MSQLSAAVVTTRPNLPVSRLTIDGEVLDSSILVKLHVTKAVGRHDDAKISLLWPTTKSADIERKPITFSYGSGTHSGRFHGYVYATEKEQQFQKQPLTTIHCLGATWPMRRVEPRLFVNRTAQQILDEVTRPHGLSARVDESNYTFPRLAQTAGTDWEVVLELGSRLGMLTTSSNGVVRLVNPFSEISKRVPSKRLEKSTQVMDPEFLNLMDFSPTNSVTTNREHLQPTFGYFGSDGSVTTYVPDCDPADMAVLSNRYVPDAPTALQHVEAMTRWNNFNQRAAARVRGDGSVNPGDPVSVNTGVSSTIVDDYDGMWLVASVAHIIDSKSFYTSLNLVRDEYRRPVFNTDYQRFWERDNRLLPSLSLVNGKWVSSWR